MEQIDSCKPIPLVSSSGAVGLQSLFRAESMQKSEAEENRGSVRVVSGSGFRYVGRSNGVSSCARNSMFGVE